MADSSTVSGPRDSKPGDSPKRTGIGTFIRQVIAELRKVVYPTQEQLVTYFFVVVVFVVVMMAIVSALDLGFGRLVFLVFSGGDGV